MTSIDKALEVCEVLSGVPRGMSLSDLARALRQPASTVHRLLGVLKKRGYVRQDDETQRYGLTLKMLDLSFRSLGQSELRLHAYPIMREYVLRTPYRGFIAIPSSGEVTYVWSTGPDDVAMRTVYGKEMPGHCAIYFSPRQATRRLSCLRLAAPAELSKPEATVVRLGPPPVEPDALQRLFCVCAPVRDYTGQEVARVGVFGHGADDRPILNEHHRGAWDLARRISMRLGHLPASALESTA
ncbi:MAG TPA: helix-turn-helix domain-containing protein [Vicinamibacterales bacterium]|jgi:DNA-binding IclR family transcriptional regulator|nr:helix-turn-helix domain-containing protein [Vicinamibacterales bacterium]